MDSPLMHKAPAVIKKPPRVAMTFFPGCCCGLSVVPPEKRGDTDQKGKSGKKPRPVFSLSRRKKQRWNRPPGGPL